MKPVSNPLNTKAMKEKVAPLFGKTIAEKICTTPVFKYNHASIGEGKGDQRKK